MRFTLLILVTVMLQGMVVSTCAAMDAAHFFSSVQNSGGHLLVVFSGQAEGYELSVNDASQGAVQKGDSVELHQKDWLLLEQGDVRITASPRITSSLVGLDVQMEMPDVQGRGLTVTHSVFVEAG